jgi:hypothetical protein
LALLLTDEDVDYFRIEHKKAEALARRRMAAEATAREKGLQLQLF